MKPLTTLTITLLLISIALYSQNQAGDSLKYCVDKNSVGIGGYDPVSYFESNVPSLGTHRIQARYDGVIYHFSSERNKKAFLLSPEKYLPQFGGWCSMTLVLGKATKPTYTNFLIRSGKFYLFERTLSVNGKELWLKDSQRNEKIAAMNYDELKTTGKVIVGQH